MRKAELMYRLFGKADGHCRDCEHLVVYKHHDKTVRKCEVYGDTRSEATDWAGKYDACGLFPDKKYNGKPVVRTVRGERKHEADIEGQMCLPVE